MPLEPPAVVVTYIDAVVDAGNGIMRARIMGRTYAMKALYADVITYAANDQVLAEYIPDTDEYVIVGRLE